MSDARITIRENGSLRIEGEIPLYDHEGNPLTIPIGKPYAHAAADRAGKPFCDGSHKTNGFDGTLARE